MKTYKVERKKIPKVTGVYEKARGESFKLATYMVMAGLIFLALVALFLIIILVTIFFI